MHAYEHAFIMNAMEQSGTSSSKLLQALGGRPPSGSTTAAAAPASAPQDEVRYSSDTESIMKGLYISNRWRPIPSYALG